MLADEVQRGRVPGRLVAALGRVAAPTSAVGSAAAPERVAVLGRGVGRGAGKGLGVGNGRGADLGRGLGSNRGACLGRCARCLARSPHDAPAACCPSRVLPLQCVRYDRDYSWES